MKKLAQSPLGEFAYWYGTRVVTGLLALAALSMAFGFGNRVFNYGSVVTIYTPVRFALKVFLQILTSSAVFLGGLWPLWLLLAFVAWNIAWVASMGILFGESRLVTVVTAIPGFVLAFTMGVQAVIWLYVALRAAYTSDTLLLSDALSMFCLYGIPLSWPIWYLVREYLSPTDQDTAMWDESYVLHDRVKQVRGTNPLVIQITHRPDDAQGNKE